VCVRVCVRARVRVRACVYMHVYMETAWRRTRAKMATDAIRHESRATYSHDFSTLPHRR